ncbi:MAG: phospholipid carrier-dependent glycosyltransferase, partial [Candidatus Altiarchaeales archaeon]|nr:phospholipid carrier-dependent glycosyltransferase [Candidatus Altiarchaeales archaeon]
MFSTFISMLIFVKYKMVVSNRKAYYVLTLIFFIALIARMGSLYTGTHEDEGENFLAVTRILDGQKVYREVGLNRPLFMVWLMKPVIDSFGEGLTSLFILRMVSCLATASICFPVFGLGKIFSNREIGLWAALLYALEPFSVHFNTFIHPSNFYVVFATWAVYLFNRGLYKKSTPTGIISGLCAGLAIIVKHSGLVILAYFLTFFVFYKKFGKHKNENFSVFMMGVLISCIL